MQNPNQFHQPPPLPQQPDYPPPPPPPQEQNPNQQHHQQQQQSVVYNPNQHYPSQSQQQPYQQSYQYPQQQPQPIYTNTNQQPQQIMRMAQPTMYSPPYNNNYNNANSSDQQNQQLPLPYQNQLQQPNYHQHQQQQPHNSNTHIPYNYTTTRQPYIDPDTKIIYPITEITLSGYLTKQSDWLKDWRRRYFILTPNNQLFFCKNEYCAPHGRIDLSTCTTVKSADVKSRKKFSFEISTHDKMYLMYADSEKEKDDWIGAVGKSIVRSSRTFLDKDHNNHGNGEKKRNKGGGVDRRTAINSGYGYDYDDYDDDDSDSDYGGEGGIFENQNNHPYFND